MDFHKILAKQITKLFPAHLASDSSLIPFFKAIGNYYHTLEKDKEITEHAFEVSEREYQAVMRNLKQEIQIRRHSIERIRQQILSLENSGVSSDSPPDNSDDLIQVIRVLETQVEKTKQLEEDLIRAKEMAESSAKAKSNFLSVMSHEIRTPLNAIIGNIHILMQETYLHEQEPYIQALHISAENLLNLVNDILDFNKIEEGKVEMSPRDVNVRQLMQHLVQTNQFKAAERSNVFSLVIDPAIPHFLRFDDLRLSQILNNLISNANKFTEKGWITIELKYIESNTEGVKLNFSVTDTGIGIAPEKHDLIFERFTQANSEINRSYGGSGLGLTIIKKLLGIMGSNIQLDSEPGKGSCFYFTLIGGHSEKTFESIEEEINEVQDLSGVKILLVEDVPFNVLVAKKILSNWNAMVDVANHGGEAITKCEGTIYDIILMDLQMPVMDGIRATQALRTKGLITPIVALTASSSPDTLLMVKEVGMNNYVSKPFNPNDLYKTIKSELKLAAL